MKMPECDVCGDDFDTERGVINHKAQSSCGDDEPETTPDSAGHNAVPDHSYVAPDCPGLDVYHVGGHRFRVINPRKSTGYHVNMEYLECECIGDEFGDAEDVCKHIKAAAAVGPDTQTVDHMAFRSFIDLFQEARKATEDIEDLRNVRRAIQDSNAAASAETAEGSAPSQETASESSSAAVSNASDPSLAEQGYEPLDNGPDALVHVMESELDEKPPIVVRETSYGDGGWEIREQWEKMTDEQRDTWNDMTGPDGKTWIKPIWPDDYEDGDGPEGQFVPQDHLDTVAEMI